MRGAVVPTGVAPRSLAHDTREAMPYRVVIQPAAALHEHGDGLQVGVPGGFGSAFPGVFHSPGTHLARRFTGFAVRVPVFLCDQTFSQHLQSGKGRKYRECYSGILFFFPLANNTKPRIR